MSFEHLWGSLTNNGGLQKNLGIEWENSRKCSLCLIILYLQEHQFDVDLIH